MPAEEHPRNEREEELVEEYSFDTLARTLAEGTLSRERALKLVGAAILGGALSIFALPDQAEAKKKKRRGSHRNNRNRNSGPGPAPVPGVMLPGGPSTCPSVNSRCNPDCSCLSDLFGDAYCVVPIPCGTCNGGGSGCPSNTMCSGHTSTPGSFSFDCYPVCGTPGCGVVSPPPPPPPPSPCTTTGLQACAGTQTPCVCSTGQTCSSNFCCRPPSTNVNPNVNKCVPTCTLQESVVPNNCTSGVCACGFGEVCDNLNTQTCVPFCAGAC
jgi:hypothetical protein